MKKCITSILVLFLAVPAVAAPEQRKEFTLDEILSLGLSNSPAILAKAQEVEAKKAAFQASKRLTNPEFGYQTGKGELNDTPGKINTDSLSLSQYLENPFKRHYRVQMFEKEWQASEHHFRFSQIEITFEIKRHFNKILLLKNEEELSQKNLASLEEIHQLILKRVELGETRELEAIKLHVEILKAQNELNKIRTELRLAKENLNKFLGNSLPADFSILGKLEYRPHSLDEQSLLEKALLSHPLIQGKERELEFAESQLKYIKWQRLPDFELSGFINNELDGKNKGIGISLDIPLWNFKSKEIAEAESLYQKQNHELTTLKMEIVTEVKSRLNELRYSEQTLRIFHEGLLKLADESLKISEKSYRQGEISFIDYLDSQRTYTRILKDYQESLYAWNITQAALEKSIGEEIK